MNVTNWALVIGHWGVKFTYMKDIEDYRKFLTAYEAVKNSGEKFYIQHDDTKDILDLEYTSPGMPLSIVIERGPRIAWVPWHKGHPDTSGQVLEEKPDGDYLDYVEMREVLPISDLETLAKKAYKVFSQARRAAGYPANSWDTISPDSRYAWIEAIKSIYQ